MEPLEKVIEDIEKHLGHPSRRISKISDRRDTPSVGLSAALTFYREKILKSVTPMKLSSMMRLNDHITAHPEVIAAADYPLNIIEWIRGNLMNWDEDDLLGSYNPKQQTIELYWLCIQLCAEMHNLLPQDLGMVADIHAWCHAMVHVGEDADENTVGNVGKHTREVSEGLAQFFAHHYLKKMFSAAYFHTFVKLMEKQPPAYHAHIHWLSENDLKDYQELGFDKSIIQGTSGNTPGRINRYRREAVRYTMLTALRKKPDLTLEEFNERFVEWEKGAS